MPIYKGTLKTGAAYKGNVSLQRIYKGAYLVFEAFKTLIAEGVPPITLLNCAAEIMLGYRIYGNSKQQLLPDGYTQLEYIRTTGTQYIDTGVAYDDTSIEVNFIGTIETNSTLFGIRRNGRVSNTFKISAVSNKIRASKYSENCDTDLSMSSSIIYNFILNNNVFNVDGTTLYSFSTSAYTTNFNLYLFAEDVISTDGNSSTAEAKSSAKCYACKIYKNNVIIRNFVPCKNSSDIIGLYDTVNNVFYANAGTGTFTAGSTATVPNPDSPIEIQSVGDKVSELPYGYIELNYIEANGAQYIDTGFSPDSNTKVNYKVETTAGDFDASPFIGARVGNINTARFFPIAYNSTDGECRTSFGSKSGVITNVIAGTVFEGSFDPINGVSTINGTVYDISDAGFQKIDNYNLYLFATPGYSSNLYLSHGKIYYCKIWDNGTLVRDFIPCKNDSNVVGMYDTVNKVFYSSETSEPLIAGNEMARGGYRIPVNVTDANNITTTTNIYLSEPLRKLGSYSDYIDFETGKVVRKINYNEFTGLFNEITRYSNYSRYGGYQFSPRNAINLNVEKCNYLSYTPTPNGFIVGANTGASFYLYDDVTGVTAEDDTGAKRTAKAVAWLRSLSPRLRVYYVLETETEETITLPDILLNKGTNIISVDTTTQPSNMWIKYKGKN